MALGPPPSWAERPPSDDELRLLQVTYETSTRTGSWPLLEAVDSQYLAESSGRSVDFELATMPLGLLWPDPAAGASYYPGQTLAVTIYGLTFVGAAADDVNTFFELMRWAVEELATSVAQSAAGSMNVPVGDAVNAIGRATGTKVDPSSIARVLSLAAAAAEPSVPAVTGSPGDPRNMWIAIPPELGSYQRLESLHDYLERRSPRPLRTLAPAGQAAAYTARTRDDTTTGDDPEAPATLDLPPRTAGDLAAEIDALGFTPLVAGIADLVDATSTLLPLTIAITGDWGAGKSSMMRQLSDRLREPHLGRSWRIVEFDAWKYEQGERLWAGLTKAIYEAALQDRGPIDSIRFKTTLEWARAGKWRWIARALLPFVPLALAATYVFAFGATGTAKNTSWLLGAAAAVGAVFAAARGIGGFGSIVADPFKRAIDLYTFRGRFQEQLGFSVGAASDVEALTRCVTADGHALAVFIDDLDRCSPASIVEVVESVNQIFNASRKNQTLFVLGMDLDIVTASIEAAYGATMEKLPPDRQREFGRDYLRKIAQLFVAVPTPDTPSLVSLLDSMEDPSVLAPTAIPEAQVAAAQSQIREEAPTTAAEVSAVAEELPVLGAVATAVVAEATRRERALRFGSNAADVAAVVRELIAFLPPNPRTLKQFDTAFRLQLHVANDSPQCRLSFSYNQLLALGKWVVVRMRWPTLAEEADRDPALLRRLEDLAGSDGHHEAYLQDTELRALLAEADASRRIGDLPLESFLRVV